MNQRKSELRNPSKFNHFTGIKGITNINQRLALAMNKLHNSALYILNRYNAFVSKYEKLSLGATTAPINGLLNHLLQNTNG